MSMETAKWGIGRYHRALRRSSTGKSLPVSESQRPNQEMADKAEQSIIPIEPIEFEGSYTFDEDQPLPWKHIDNLGRGGFGSVDKVQHMQSGEILARKILRYHPRQAKRVKIEFEKEIAHLKKLNQHHHIVRLVCSYQQGCDFGILMLPVTPGNLYDFLRRPVSAEDRDQYMKDLFQSVGCLLNALSFIHSHGVRHKDIKPQNILVDPQSSSKFIITDFGLSRDFSDLSKSQTSGRPDAFSARYCAPEVAAYTKRGRKADIFSLGCVFVEIAAVTSCTKVDELENLVLASVGDEYAETMSFSTHHEGISDWIRLQQNKWSLMGSPIIFDLCQFMINETPSNRPPLSHLLRVLRLYQMELPLPFYFCNHCDMIMKLGPKLGDYDEAETLRSQDFSRLWLCNYLRNLILNIKKAREYEFLNGIVDRIILYTRELHKIDPQGLGKVAKNLFEVALAEQSSLDKGLPTLPSLEVVPTNYVGLFARVSMSLDPSEREIFQSHMNRLCEEEFDMMIKGNNSMIRARRLMALLSDQIDSVPSKLISNFIKYLLSYTYTWPEHKYNDSLTESLKMDMFTFLLLRVGGSIGLIVRGDQYPTPHTARLRLPAAIEMPDLSLQVRGALTVCSPLILNGEMT
ncbi:MAG: hypothetical protein M1812_004548 [Candelaria pacifica]|nr:MAG: hypothetical protein M1812_004548 [Candelaria pacifica]